MIRLVIVLGIALLAFGNGARGAASPSFNRDVRPIFSEKCFHCHGPDEKQRKSDLRLDFREAALKGGKSGPAFVPGKPDQSELLKRVLTKDEDDVMPPTKLHKPVTAAEAQVLRQWIADGAKYEGHWAFLKPVRPTPPLNTPNPIDAFIQKKLADQGLKPSPEASKETLIRRVTLDLTGLPPTPKEVAAFVADPAPMAYERLVDRLLSSPRYGEHMAARWLDMARYADSNGFQSDTSRQMWHWRDWLIEALNSNLPFDRFTIEQLAGDLLPNATRDQIVATGFHRNQRLNGEGGRIVDEWFAETVIDRVETTGLTWMALTLNCCRCHDHKYDPITQKEFYQFFAYFNSVDELGVLDEFGGAARTRKGGNSKPVLELSTPEQEAAVAQATVPVKAAEARLAQLKTTVPARMAAWEAELGKVLTESRKPAWTPLDGGHVKSTGGAAFTRQADATWLASGTNIDYDTYTITAPCGAGAFTGFMLEVFPDASLPEQSLGRNANGNFVLSTVAAKISAPTLKTPLAAIFNRAEADFEQTGWPVQSVVETAPKVGAKATPKAAKAARAARKNLGWAVDGENRKEPARAMFVTAAPLTVPEDATITITLRHTALPKHNIGRFRVSLSGLPAALLTLKDAGISETVRTALQSEPVSRTPQQKEELAKLFAQSGDAELKQAETELAAAKKRLEELEQDIPNTMIMRERPAPRDAFVLKRGEYDKLGDKVERGVPAALPPFPAGAPNSRLGLAQWLVSGEHPLTARVWVNRAWENFFGAGIVRTTENFGSQADWPTHPELLDWLATEFVRVKWDMKAMHRLMVTSATYRQSSQVTAEQLAKDPENRLLAHAPRLRLSGEALRDQALYVSGLLVEKVGGPSVRPYMPAAVWDETSVYGDMRNYQPDTGEGLYRRTLYTIWKRTAAPPSMLLFDSASREICTVKRSRSNTPTQALALLNEVTYVEAARHFAERMLTDGGSTPEARITWAFERATARRPSAFELEKLTAGLRARLARFSSDEAAAKQLISQGASKPDPKLNPAELAAYTVSANVLLNLDEVVTRN